MRILFIADEESKSLWDYFDRSKLEGVDLIISCGDLSPDYLQFLVTMGRAPLLYVYGNHDESYDFRPPLGCECIEDRVYDFRGLRILGLGGSYRYRKGSHMYTEQEMRKRVQRVKRDIALKNGFDILVTHAPVKGYGDLPDLPHQGFACFSELLEKYHPKYMVHGHVHKSYGNFRRELKHPSGTRIINAYEKYLLDVGEDEHPAEGKTGSFLYDLYKQVASSRDRRFSHRRREGE